MKFSLKSSILSVAAVVAKDAELMNLMQVMVIGEDGQLERTYEGSDFREMLNSDRQTAIYDFVADLEVQANEIMETREEEVEPVNLMTVYVIGEDGQLEATHTGDEFREMLSTERQEAMYDFVADLEVQANQIMEDREAETQLEPVPVNLMTVYVIGEDGQLEATHTGEEFRGMLRTERQEAMYDFVADLEEQANEIVEAQQAAESALNLHNIGAEYMASALDESAFDNPFMEAYFEVKQEDLSMDDILLEITAMRQEQSSMGGPNIADDFLDFGSFNPSEQPNEEIHEDQSVDIESDPSGLGVLPFNLHSQSDSYQEVTIGFDLETFGQQGSELFSTLAHEVEDDVRTHIDQMSYDERARAYAESQQTEQALNDAINHIWGTVTIDGQELGEVVPRPELNFAAKSLDKENATAYYAITGSLALSAIGLLAIGVFYTRQWKKEVEVSDDYEQAAEP